MVTAWWDSKTTESWFQNNWILIQTKGILFKPTVGNSFMNPKPKEPWFKPMNLVNLLFEIHFMNSIWVRFFTKENYKQNENHDTGRIFKEEKLHRSMTNIVLVDSLEKKIIHIRLTNQPGYSHNLIPPSWFPEELNFRSEETKKKFSEKSFKFPNTLLC